MKNSTVSVRIWILSKINDTKKKKTIGTGFKRRTKWFNFGTLNQDTSITIRGIDFYQYSIILLMLSSSLKIYSDIIMTNSECHNLGQQASTSEFTTNLQIFINS